MDTALICYNLLIGTVSQNTDGKQSLKIIDALNKSAIIYCIRNDYLSGKQLFIKALQLCEKYGYIARQTMIFSNIGNIYHYFNKYDVAELYYLRALQAVTDTSGIVLLLNNLGANKLHKGCLDSASFLLSESIKISKRHNDVYLYNMLNNMALLHTKKQAYDSAFYYAHLALDAAKKRNRIDKEAEFLQTLGTAFFEFGRTDSALFYIELSNTKARENNFLKILAENYLIKSKIEKSKGHDKAALKYFEKHVSLKDSISGTNVFGDMTQLQHLYDVSKMNQQIEQFIAEEEMRMHTIHFQRIIQWILLTNFLLVSSILLFVFFQKRKLGKAYQTLFDKNLEIISFEKQSPPKYKKSTLTQNTQDELANKILTIMEDTSVICDTNFSINKLAVLTQSNYTHVSQVINTVFKKNFRLFLNAYRIREAQRLFSEPDVVKYTIDTIAFQVGFKSTSAFRDAFKEITGVPPLFFLKSMQKHNNP
ncbi:MAG: AraC family transcriptional regulator [Bacteroidales bacterium]|nr:AraC family transcriptional regulator [Bacteroidales bacterium]